mmetsp:Transcript_33900/g.59799  ORF Transcript_33900/g.59799 Transcript_33900/m.59799 type:complete len:159 (+) Transcript_33900:50-526(+)
MGAPGAAKALHAVLGLEARQRQMQASDAYRGEPEKDSWRDICRSIVENDGEHLRKLRYNSALINHRFTDDDPAKGSSIDHGGGSSELASGRQYPHRQPRQSAVGKTPPKVPVPRPHSICKFAAECRIARRNMGLGPAPERSGGAPGRSAGFSGAYTPR